MRVKHLLESLLSAIIIAMPSYAFALSSSYSLSLVADQKDHPRDIWYLDFIPTANGPIVTGTVTITANGTTYASAQLRDGSAGLNFCAAVSCPGVPYPEPTPPFQVSYSGDSVYSANTFQVTSPVSSGASTSVNAITSTNFPFVPTRSVPFTISIQGANPTGVVYFSDSSGFIGSPVRLVNGQASVNINVAKELGTPLGVDYSGDQYNLPSSGAFSITGGTAPVPAMADWAIGLLIIGLVAVMLVRNRARFR